MQILTPQPAAAPLLPPSLPTRALAADPALLQQAAAVAAATPWTALDHLVGTGRAAAIPVPQVQPLPMPPATLPAETTAPAATIIATVLNRSLGPSAAAATVLQLAALATAGVAHPASAADRLTLSPALAALRGDPVIACHRPAAALMLDLLSGLTGEAPERLQLLAFDAPDRAGQTVGAAAVPRAPGELLQLLVRGTVQGLDARQVEITLGLSVQRQSGPVRLDAALLDAPAVAVELIHAYSLVHDDLPAMDDDDLRRGQPTVHKVWDDAMGVLVGDALQTLAFETLTRDIPADGEAARRLLGVIAALGHASGSMGMVGGQAVDIESEGRRIPLERLKSLHARKTGALILACLKMPLALAAPAAAVVDALETYGRLLGLAYQIQDDVLDITQSTEQLGKTAGKDVAQEKSTYPALLGFDAAKALAESTFADARSALDELGDKADGLRWLALEIQGRNH